MDLIRVAGGILWRETPRGRRLALVHRRRQDDWSIPKGRVEPGERWRTAALREVAEETGCTAALRAFAGAKLLTNRKRPRLVLYWHMQLLEEGALELDGEVDEMRWLASSEALEWLDHPSDRMLLLRALARDRPPPAHGGSHLGRVDPRHLLVRDGADDDAGVPRVLGIVARAAQIQVRSAA